MTTRRSLYAFAMLQSAVETGATNPVHAILPLIEHTLLRMQVKEFDLNALQTSIVEDWGISIPLNVIRFCLSRPDVKSLFQYDVTKARYRVVGGSTLSSNSLVAEQLARKKYDLVSTAIQHAKTRESRTDLTVDEIIFKWLDTVSDSSISNVPAPSILTSDEIESNRIVAICLLSDNISADFKNAITDLALGDILYQSIVYASEYEILDPERPSESIRMDRVSAYLDTGVLFRVLGYFGTNAEVAANELLQMCRATGCELRAFDHTVVETQEGLLAFASRFYSGSGAYGPMLDWALSSRMTKSDLIEEADLIYDRLSSLGILVESPIAISTSLSISETQLDYEIDVGVQQDNPLARQRDVRSLAAIFRLRNGETKEFLENCSAIFVTSNPSLARAATRYFNREFTAEGKRPGVQICMTDVTFSTRLWTTLPTRLGLAPRRQILSKAASHLRPNRTLRENFLKHLDKLVQRGALSDEKATFVRLTSFADRVLALEYDARTHELTGTQADEVVQSALLSFDRLVRSKASQMAAAATAAEIDKIRKQAEEEIHSAREIAAAETLRFQESSAALSSRLSDLEDAERKYIGRMRRKADALIRVQSVSRTIMIVMIVLIVGITYTQSTSPSSSISKHFGPAVASMLALASIGSFFPKSLFSSLFYKLSSYISRRVH